MAEGKESGWVRLTAVLSSDVVVLAGGEAVEEGVDDVVEVEGFLLAGAGAGAVVAVNAGGAVELFDAAAVQVGDRRGGSERGAGGVEGEALVTVGVDSEPVFVDEGVAPAAHAQQVVD